MQSGVFVEVSKTLKGQGVRDGEQMRYKTVIELICEEKDAEEAGHLAGEYLKGNVDNGVIMHCRTMPLKRFPMARVSMVCMVIFITTFAFFLKSDNIEGKSQVVTKQVETKQGGAHQISDTGI